MPSSTRSDWKALTDDQLDEVVAIIVEQHGSCLSRRRFDDAALACLEDIAGFEGIEQNNADRLLTVLWSKYPRDR